MNVFKLTHSRAMQGFLKQPFGGLKLLAVVALSLGLGACGSTGGREVVSQDEMFERLNGGRLTGNEIAQVSAKELWKVIRQKEAFASELARLTITDKVCSPNLYQNYINHLERMSDLGNIDGINKAEKDLFALYSSVYYVRLKAERSENVIQERAIASVEKSSFESENDLEKRKTEPTKEELFKELGIFQ